MGRGVWAVEQHCSQHHQAGAAGVPRRAETQRHGGDSAQATEPPARAWLGSAPVQPPRMVFVPWGVVGGLQHKPHGQQ